MNDYAKDRPWVALPCLMLLGSFLCGCAGVRYDRLTPEEVRDINEDKSKKTRKNFGVPFYEAKPMVLVVNGVDAKGNPTRTVSLVSLPDYSKPFRAHTVRGLGKAELSLTVSNGVLTTTTAKSEGTDTFAGILAAVGTAAVAPTTIANLEADLAAKELMEDTSEAAAMQASTGFLAKVVGSIRKVFGISDVSVTIPCDEKPATGKWYKQMLRAKSKLESLDEPDESSNGLKRSIDKWLNNICTNKKLNFTASANATQFETIRSFQKEVASSYKSAGSIAKGIHKSGFERGCTDHCGDDCQLLRASAAGIAEVRKMLQVYLAEGSKPPPFELYEFTLDAKKTPDGLRRVYPASE